MLETLLQTIRNHCTSSSPLFTILSKMTHSGIINYMSIDSGATEEEEKHEDHSEWKLFHYGLGSAFQNVVVNEGFQIRDFQSSQAAVSLIDPETLGRLRREASVIQNNKMRSQPVIVLALYSCCMLPCFGFIGPGLVPDDAIPLPIGIIGSLGFFFLLHYIVDKFLQKKADAKLTALVDSYQHVFLEEYGVELGYSPRHCFGNPCINLRRPHQLGDVGDSKAMDGRYPPIYLDRLIPGEIHIDEKEYDATSSLKVDAETWTLLRSTHKKMIKQEDCNPTMRTYLTILLGWWVVGIYWAIKIRFGFFILAASTYILAWVFEYVMDKRNLRVYEEVTEAVNEALQKDKGNSLLTVEFHASELPGREGKLGRRYQFVTPHMSPSNELV